MPIPLPPSGFPSELAVLWLTAAKDGYEAGLKGLYQESNPYELHEPLFHAWRLGWAEGIYDTPLSILLKKTKSLPQNLRVILAEVWAKKHVTYNAQIAEKLLDGKDGLPPISTSL